MNRFNQRVEQLRLLSPLKYRLLALIVESMIVEASEQLVAREPERRAEKSK